MYAALQQALDLLAQLLMVDGLFGVVVHRGDYRGDDAFNIRNFHRISLLLLVSFAAYMIS